MGYGQRTVSLYILHFGHLEHVCISSFKSFGNFMENGFAGIFGRFMAAFGMFSRDLMSMTLWWVVYVIYGC